MGEVKGSSLEGKLSFSIATLSIGMLLMFVLTVLTLPPSDSVAGVGWGGFSILLGLGSFASWSYDCISGRQNNANRKT